MKKKYTIIPRSLCFIINNEKILLQKGNPKKIHWANQYNALGGHIEFQENIFSSAIREIKEESGIIISENNISLKGIIHVKTYFNENVLMFIFLSVVKSYKYKDSIEGKLEWVNIKNINKIKNIAPDVKKILQMILKTKDNELISGTSLYDKDRKLIKISLKTYKA